MSALDDLLRRAKRLPSREKKRLIRELESTLSNPKRRSPAKPKPRRSRKDALASFLALSGCGHSDFTDVASNKGKHLADAYAPKR